MSKQKVLIVEDDKDISRLVRYNLEKAGHECSQVFDGDKAFETLERFKPDLVILDVMLPGQDGFEICRIIKSDERFKNVPVIMLTAKGSEVDRVVGLELGADDYVVKPFSLRELVLRVKVILRRKGGDDPAAEVLAAGGIRMDLAAHRVFIDEKSVEFSRMEFQLLLTLIKRRGRVQSREKLLDDVWGIEADIYTRTVDTHVKRLREKLGRSGKLIETVVGVGYRFKEQDED
ncbi:MAG: response regulator transcription factor [Candidatus Omnitrophica bacterium]|nr:response regulator transcription factor [Candidatus Omnitrophota bacterium]